MQGNRHFFILKIDPVTCVPSWILDKVNCLVFVDGIYSEFYVGSVTYKEPSPVPSSRVTVYIGPHSRSMTQWYLSYVNVVSSGAEFLHMKLNEKWDVRFSVMQ